MNQEGRPQHRERQGGYDRNDRQDRDRGGDRVIAALVKIGAIARIEASGTSVRALLASGACGTA